MKVKLFDYEHEKDLEDALNDFFRKNEVKVLDVKYQTSHFFALNEQVFSFSAMLIYEDEKILETE